MNSDDSPRRGARGTTTSRGRSRYHSVSPHRVNDRRLRGSSLEAHWLWGQLLTCDLVTMPGLIKGGPGALAEVTGREVELIRKALIELTQRGMVEVDEETCLLRLVGTLIDHVRPMESGNTLKGFFSILRNLPPSPLVLAHAQEIASVFQRSDDEGIRAMVRLLIDQLLLVQEREVGEGRPRSAVPAPRREHVTDAKPLAGASDEHDREPQALAKGLSSPDQDHDPDHDPDHNSPLVPQGGKQDEREVDEGQDAPANDERPDASPYTAIAAALDRGRRVLDMPGPAPPFDDNDRRKLRRFVNARGPDVLEAVPRAIDRLAAHLKAQRQDRRHEFNLTSVLRQFDMLRAATHLDKTRAGPPTMLASPTALLLHATGGRR